MTESLRDKLIRCCWASSISADTLVSLIERHYAEQGAMLDQAMQAAETLRDCWLERTGLTVEDDPFVEDACSTIQSIRSFNHENTNRPNWPRPLKFLQSGNIGVQPVILNEGRTQRGNGVGAPTTPKPNIIPKGQGRPTNPPPQNR